MELAKLKAQIDKEKQFEELAKKSKRTLEEKIERARTADSKRDKWEKAAKSKKTELQKTKEEFDKMVEVLENKPEPIEEKKEELSIEESDEWDVKIGDHILYFDSNLSYELTGYRPINLYKGLDFDPEPFCEMANIYRTTGKYTNLIPKTMAYDALVKRELDRCINGLTIGKYRITGDNYFWLNYYLLLDSARIENLEVGAGRKREFPIFIAKLYEYFHYLELCKKTKKDFCVLKARATGASEIACSLAARLYTTTPNTFLIITASGDNLLSPTILRCWQELDFLNGETQGMFRHLRQKQDTKDEKRASKITKDKRETGWMSTIKGVISDDPGKLRGHRVEALYFEEAGFHSNLVNTFIESEALTVVGGKKIGIRCVFGTGGESGKQLAGLSKIFKNPNDFNILPYRHEYTFDRTVAYTGFFIPSFTIWFGDADKGIKGMDSRGVTFEESAKKYYINKWDTMTDAQARIKDLAEHCFTPELALMLEGDNQFDREKLSEQLARIELHKTVDPPRKAKLVWKFKDGEVDRTLFPELIFDETGKIDIVELPMTDENGIPFKNLYVIGCLTPGEKVMTDSGLKNCEDITLDDKLFSIDGKEVNIINLLRYYKENEDIYKVKLNNIFSTTTFTGEHPIYCATPEKHYHNHKTAVKHNLLHTYYKYKFGFKLMKDVLVGDFVKVPNIYKKEKPIPFDKWDESNIRVDFRVGNHLNNTDFWWLIGLLLGDGWAKYDNRGIGVVFNTKEQFYIDKANKIILNLFNRKLRLCKNKGSALEYSINCLYLNKFFTENFGRGAKNKHIPEWVKYLPYNLKYNLVMGYLASDGCVCVSSDSLNFVSCSLKLLEDIQDILFSLGIVSTVNWLRKEEKYYKIAGSEKVSHVSKTWALDIHGEMVNKFKRMCTYPDLKLDKWLIKEYTNHAIPRCFFEDDSCDYIYIKIASIELSKYTGIVYNYHCETSTFMCKYIPTHNCDSIDSDTDTSSGQDDVSLFAIVVLRRMVGLQPPKVVAIYKDRPRDIRTAFDNAMKLAMFYNCLILLESTRVSIVTYFKEKGKLNLFMLRPEATIGKYSTRQSRRLIGTAATKEIIAHLLDLIEYFINDYCEGILFPDLINELLSYSYENKRKFDLVAALAMALLGNEDMEHKVVKMQASNLRISDIGWYRDEYGRATYGVIPKEPLKQTLNYEWIRETDMSNTGENIQSKMVSSY